MLDDDVILFREKRMVAHIDVIDHSDGFNSLGVPVDNLTMEEAISRIFGLIEAYRLDGKAKLVATLNVDFMVNSLGYFFQTPRHPELLEILRSASLVTADGFPVVWLSYFFGQPLKQRVTGADLVPQLSAAAAKEGYSIYLFGGREEAAIKCAEKLTEASPNLNIAGIDCPMVSVEGEAALSHLQDDAIAIEKINAAKPDILFIGLGNPKQEQWFHRNRHRLKVGVAIGIGGTFEFMAGTVKRAPTWIQKSNLEWIYRISQDPKRLWKRYVNGLIKFGLLSLPIAMYRIQELAFPVKSESFEFEWNTLWGSRTDVVRTLTMPKVVTSEFMVQLIAELKQHRNSDCLFVIDFSKVRRIQLAAYHEIYRLGQLFQSHKVDGLLLGMKRKIQRRLEAARIRDAFAEHVVQTELRELPGARELRGSDDNTSLQCRSYVLKDAVLVYLSGVVSGDALRDLGLDVIIGETIKTKDCIVDLSQIKLLETTGAISLCAFSEVQKQRPKAMFISGVNHSAKQIFKLSKLDDRVQFMDDQQFHHRLFLQG